MPRDTRAAFLRALDAQEPLLAEAFERAIQDVRGTAQRRSIEDAIRRAVETGDISGGVAEILEALRLDAEFFGPLDRAIEEAFRAGAAYQLDTLPSRTGAGRLVVRFQGRHPRAEAWTRTNAAALITEITEGTREVVRETIVDAVDNSLSYRSVARMLLGSIEGNEQKGALIGLHTTQARAVRAARTELQALDTSYFRRDRRDKRFDRTVAKAIREGKALKVGDVDKITGRYADRLLRLRADSIARTEGSKAMNAGRHEAVQQMIDSGTVPADLVTKIWDATPGSRTRDSHRALNGTRVKWGERFVSPVTGAALEHPHDQNAPAGEVINCRCSERIRINWAGMAR